VMFAAALLAPALTMIFLTVGLTIQTRDPAMLAGLLYLTLAIPTGCAPAWLLLVVVRKIATVMGGSAVAFVVLASMAGLGHATLVLAIPDRIWERFGTAIFLLGGGYSLLGLMAEREPVLYASYFGAPILAGAAVG